MADLLSVRSINKTFGATRVVRDLSFAVQEGEIFGLLGPNGAGKSTTIRCILGIILPDSGDITFSFAKNGTARHSIGYLPEERGLYKDVPVLDIILYLASLKGYPLAKARQRAEVLLERFSLSKKGKAKVEELSKGMAQKVQFIASIIHEPKLLILDEPFSGLDPVSQDILKAEVRALAGQGTAILLSAHQMHLVEELCDRISLINQGQQAVYGRMIDIKTRFAEQKCVIHGDNGHIDFERLPAVRRAERDKAKTTLYVHASSSMAELLKELPVGTEIDELRIERISLHDIFVNVTQGGASHVAR
ncbi:MAG: ABC-type transporter ATP-binding protein EcsA [Firmicutes bacterium]|nr:ABC-type transporter ATP-binding protein EcsA [Bacillota bacterium]